MPPQVRTVPNVELVRVGVWPGLTGRVELSREDLTAMVEAANDSDVPRAAVRIGHVDPRFDGEPALGWVENLRVEGDRLLGDLVGVPAMLASVMPTAYRRRSAELAFRVRTSTGKRYRAILTGLALLGVREPAVEGLADVLDLFRSEREPAAAGAAALSSSQVEAYGSLALYDDVDDPELVEALEEARRAVAHLATASEMSGEDADRLLSQMETAARAANENPADEPEEQTMDPKRLRQLLGLPEDATDAQVEAALQGSGEEPAEQPSEQPSEEEEPAGEEEPEEQPSEQEEAGAPEREPELVTLSRGQYDRLMEQAQQGASAFQTIREQQVEATVEAALSQGRIAPADREAWTERLENDFDGTRALLASLTPVFPTAELGHGGSGVGTEPDDAAWDNFLSDVLGVEEA